MEKDQNIDAENQALDTEKTSTDEQEEVTNQKTLEKDEDVKEITMEEKIDKFYLEIRNPYTKEIELKELHLVRDTVKRRKLEKNEKILFKPANDYYFKIK